MKTNKEKLDFLTDKLLAYGPSKKTAKAQPKKTNQKAKKKNQTKDL